MAHHQTLAIMLILQLSVATATIATTAKISEFKLATVDAPTILAATQVVASKYGLYL